MMRLQAPAAADNVIEYDPVFRERFDKEPFAFNHGLATHPLLTSDYLLGLAKRLSVDSRDVYYDAGRVSVDQRWDRTPVCDLPVDELLRRIETADAWIVLRKAEKDPSFAELLDQCMSRIEELSGIDLKRVMKLRNAIIFINSPHRISTYHIDRECNCLLQIRGTKTISVFDRNDREVLPQEEIERFWAVDNNSALYKPHLQERARVFELTPGGGVHVPVNAPHWVRNGPEVSVSLSINFHYHDALLADVYRANYWLRRAGLQPVAPRGSLVRDAAKSAAYRSVRAINSTVRRLARRTPS